jgi:methylated-DNA-[protein]-cysteine S-methyltransferase
MSLQLTMDRILTPLGQAYVLSDTQGRVRALDWIGYEDRLHRLLRQHYGDAVKIAEGARPSKASRKLLTYFEGDLTAIDQIDVEAGGTPFQKSVWAALRKIPAGQTISYGALAKRLKRPDAVRAVGAANAANPICVVVPCHRLLGADGSLTGYSGGLHRKQWLLVHEGAVPDT